MATSGVVGIPFNVKIHMASALPANAAHTIVFSGPQAGPEELQINSGGTLGFTDANWSVDQNVNVTPKRPGTLALNYKITSAYTREVKTGSISLFADQPQDQFVQSGDFIGSNGESTMFAGQIYQEIGYYDATVISGTLRLNVTLGPSGNLIYRKNPAGVISLFDSTNATHAIPEIGHHRFFAFVDVRIDFATFPSINITATDSSGTHVCTYTRLRSLMTFINPTDEITGANSTFLPFTYATNPVASAMDGMVFVPGVAATRNDATFQGVTISFSGTDVSGFWNFTGNVKFTSVGQNISLPSFSDNTGPTTLRIAPASPVTEAIPGNLSLSSQIHLGVGGAATLTLHHLSL